MSNMSPFYVIAGVVVTAVGIAAIAIVAGVYIAVKFFGLTLTLGTIKTHNDDE